MRDLPSIVADYDSKAAELKAAMKTLNATSGAGERLVALDTVADKNTELSILFKELMEAVRS